MRAAGVLGQQAPAGGATIAHVGVGTLTTTTGTTLSVALDAGHSTGDLLIVAVDVADDATITGPAGWTQVAQLGGTAGTDNQAGAWYRFATGAEGATADWTIGSSLAMWGICVAYSGVASVGNTSTNVLRTGGATGASYGGTLPTVDSGDWLVFVCAPNAGNISMTEPSGTAEIYDTAGVNPLAVAHQGPLGSAPSAADWTTSVSAQKVTIPVLLKV